MAGKHPGLPKPSVFYLSKQALRAQLRRLDQDADARKRVLELETRFRARIESHVASLPAEDSNFARFNTSHFVLMIHALKRGYSHVHRLEQDILPAKEFSSMETSAGRMVEAVMLPAYGWEVVSSEMHTANSALDGKCLTHDTLRLCTLKSGPRCLNDEMSENFADAILTNAVGWASQAGVTNLDFTYGVLYGTRKQSNKKDWHILRKLAEKLGPEHFNTLPHDRWDCQFAMDGITVTTTVRIGVEWWEHLGGAGCLLELCLALIRACVTPSTDPTEPPEYTISDLSDIVSLEGTPSDFNVSLIQRSQLEWLFFLYRHFCDGYKYC